jgi:hypothetical protein
MNVLSTPIKPLLWAVISNGRLEMNPVYKT